jgi:hypothetical protein
MTKIDNITNSLMSNPLVFIVIALFVLLIILGIIRLLNPGFSAGAEIKGHFGSLNAGMRIEGFEDGEHNGEHNEEHNEGFGVIPGNKFAGSDNSSGSGSDDGYGEESFTNQY